MSNILDWLFGKSRTTKRKATSLFKRLFSRGVGKHEAQVRALFEAEAPPSLWRKLSPKELLSAGLSPTSKRYTTAAKGGKIAAATTISEKAMRNKRALAETGSTLKGSEAPTRLSAGMQPYKSAQSEDIAHKQHETAIRRRLAKDARAVRSVNHPGGGSSGRASRSYIPSATARERYLKNRDRKLAGQELSDGEWHEMVDIATAINDPQLRLLRLSKNSPNVIKSVE